MSCSQNYDRMLTSLLFAYMLVVGIGELNWIDDHGLDLEHGDLDLEHGQYNTRQKSRYIAACSYRCQNIMKKLYVWFYITKYVFMYCLNRYGFINLFSIFIFTLHSLLHFTHSTRETSTHWVISSCLLCTNHSVCHTFCHWDSLFNLDLRGSSRYGSCTLTGS